MIKDNFAKSCFLSHKQTSLSKNSVCAVLAQHAP